MQRKLVSQALADTQWAKMRELLSALYAESRARDAWLILRGRELRVGVLIELRFGSLKVLGTI